MAAGEKFLMVILHMGKNNCGENFEGYFSWAKNYCWWQPAKFFRVLSSYGNRTFLGAEVKVKFSDGQRGVFGYYLCVVPGRIEGF